MKGFRISAIAFIIAISALSGHVCTATTSLIEFSSNLILNSPSVQISCKSSQAEERLKSKTCPVHLNYWLKHAVLQTTQKLSLAFVPSYDDDNDGLSMMNRNWCWSRDFEWGTSFVKDLYIFSNPDTLSSNTYFQLRSDGIYRLINSNAQDQDDFILVEEWARRDESIEGPCFTCTTEGRFRDPAACDVFHVCEAYDGGFKHSRFDCPDTTVYCEQEDKCGWEEDCPC